MENIKYLAHNWWINWLLWKTRAGKRTFFIITDIHVSQMGFKII